MSNTDQRTEQENQNLSEDQTEKQFKKARNRLRLLAILLLIPIILLIIREGWIGVSSDDVVLEPDYALIDDEANAKPTDDDQEKLEAEAGGGAVALAYSDKVTYSMADNMVYLDFANPSSSIQSMILQVIVYGEKNADTGKPKEYLLAESGILRPGNRVDQLNGDKDERVKLSEGNYSGVIRLLFYDPDTGEKSIVGSEIQVTIAVQQNAPASEDSEEAAETPEASTEAQQ